jgi:superfamily II DNA helicase RecQ
VQEFWPRHEIFDHARDKIIIYYRSRDEVYELATMLKCPSYTSESGSKEERAIIISQWIGNSGQPAIIATSALGIGFDYTHVRWVIHVDAPGEASSFSQESGRAGQDGKQAASIVPLWSRWKPDLEGHLSPDQEAMVGSCLYFRVEGRRFNHAAGKCSRRFQWIQAKKDAYQTQKSRNVKWIRRYVVCWECYQPQDICRVADPAYKESECRFPDMVMPL